MRQNYDHFAYGEMLAGQLKPISHSADDRHFYRTTEIEELQDLIDRLSSAHGIVLVAIDGKNSDFNYNNSDSLMQKPQYFFLVLKETASSDSDTVFAAQKDCEAVALQIIARMLRDGNFSDKPMLENPLRFLEENSFTIRGIGPVASNFYGVILGFNLNYGVNYTIDKTMWKE